MKLSVPARFPDDHPSGGKICSNPAGASRCAEPHRFKEIVMPLESKPTASPATVTLKQMAAELAESHDLSRKQAEAVLGDLMTLATKHLKNGDKIRLTGPASCKFRIVLLGWEEIREQARLSRSRPARRSHSGQPRS